MICLEVWSYLFGAAYNVRIKQLRKSYCQKIFLYLNKARQMKTGLCYISRVHEITTCHNAQPYGRESYK
jgi:hypothetical protein